MFEPLEMAQWLRGRPEPALYDLATPAVGRPVPDPPPVPESIADLSEPPAGVTIQTLLASAYEVHPDRVLVTAGRRSAQLIAFLTTFAEALSSDSTAGTLVLEQPAEEFLRRLPAQFGIDLNRFERGVEDEGDSFEGVGEEPPGSVWLSYPHDPTGCTLSPDVIAEVSRHVEAAGERLIIDELATTASGTTGFPLADLVDGTGIVILGTMSRFPDLDRLGVGWIIADSAFIDRARTIRDYWGEPSSVAVSLCQRGLYHGESLTKKANSWLDANRQRVRTFVDDRRGVSGTVPDEGHLLTLEHDRLDGNALAAAAWEAGVLVLPGRFVECPAQVRISLGRPPEDFAASLVALSGVLETTS